MFDKKDTLELMKVGDSTLKKINSTRENCSKFVSIVIFHENAIHVLAIKRIK